MSPKQLHFASAQDCADEVFARLFLEAQIAHDEIMAHAENEWREKLKAKKARQREKKIDARAKNPSRTLDLHNPVQKPSRFAQFLWSIIT